MCNLINTHTLKTGSGSCKQSAALGAGAYPTMWYRGKNSAPGTGPRKGGQEQGWRRYESEDDYRDGSENASGNADENRADGEREREPRKR